jgi:antirestriction protein ArdC
MSNDKAYQVITDRIIGLLEQGTAPWNRPWDASQGMPRNLVSKREYNGINVWLLNSLSYTSPFYLTFNQAKALGGQVRKGEKGCPVVFWKVYTKEDQETGEEEKRFTLKYYTVFNASQVDGIKVPAIEKVERVHTPIEACAKLVGGYPLPPTITHGGSQAFYRPSDDAVHMPVPESFAVRERYYSTLFHELVHSSGHSSRLNRSTLKDMVRFGDTSYAKEELVAEMGATFLCSVVGIENVTIHQSASYIKGWLSALRNDPKMLIQAASQAQKAAEYIQNHKAVVTEEE